MPPVLLPWIWSSVKSGIRIQCYQHVLLERQFRPVRNPDPLKTAAKVGEANHRNRQRAHVLDKAKQQSVRFSGQRCQPSTAAWKLRCLNMPLRPVKCLLHSQPNSPLPRGTSSAPDPQKKNAASKLEPELEKTSFQVSMPYLFGIASTSHEKRTWRQTATNCIRSSNCNAYPMLHKPDRQTSKTNYGCHKNTSV